MAEQVEADNCLFEISYNDRAQNDQVYFYLEVYDGETVEFYLEPLEFKKMLKAMMRLDETL